MNERSLSDAQRREILFREYLDLQEEQENSGAMPVGRTIFSRFGWLFQLLAALNLGLLCASLGVFMVYMITRVMFHLDVSRYFPY